MFTCNAGCELGLGDLFGDRIVVTADSAEARNLRRIFRLETRFSRRLPHLQHMVSRNQRVLAEELDALKDRVESLQQDLTVSSARPAAASRPDSSAPVAPIAWVAIGSLLGAVVTRGVLRR